MMNLIMVIHCHQPVGNFDHVFEMAVNKCYLPMLKLLDQHPSVRIGLHFSGPLLEWIEQHRHKTLDLICRMVDRKQIELLSGGFFEPLLATAGGDDVIDGKDILTGRNGICESTAVGTDTQVIPLRKGYPDSVCVEAGANGKIETNANVNDDHLNFFETAVLSGPDGICAVTAKHSIVPDVDAAAIETYLNSKVYNQAIIEWTVTMLPTVIIPYDDDDNNLLEITNFNTGEMKKVIDGAGNTNFDKVMFATNAAHWPTDPFFKIAGFLGFMEFDQRYGFIFPGIIDRSGATSSVEHTVAHELGHGQDLRHVFETNAVPAVADQDRANLMLPWAGPKNVQFRLRKSQWLTLNP